MLKTSVVESIRSTLSSSTMWQEASLPTPSIEGNSLWKRLDRAPFPFPSNQVSPPSSFRIVGQTFAAYIVVEDKAGRLHLVEQHVAHERVIFEELKRKWAGSIEVWKTPRRISLGSG